MGNRHLKCPVCGLEEDRDLIAAINLGMRGAQATQMAPDANENPRAMKGKLKNGVKRTPHFFNSLLVAQPALLRPGGRAPAERLD